MDKPNIPRLELDVFAQESFKVPLLNVELYPLDAQHFIIQDRRNYPVKDYISPNRRQFYKIFHVTSGTGILTVGLHQYFMNPGDIGFLHPDEIMSWQNTSTDTEGHFCLIHPDYFEQATHLVQLFRTYPYFKASQAVIQLNADESSKVNQYFTAILQEEEGQKEDRKQAILLHLQLILLEAQRAGKNLRDVAVPETYRYIHGFLNLLESSFRIDGPDSVVKLKTAGEFADQLHVHPNYLNALVKSQTGKTLREHIQERLLYEAKVLLTQTDWDIRSISEALGFSEQAAFTSFFSKKQQVSPSRYREKALARVNI